MKPRVERELGIPTVTHRLIQQALLQILQPILAPTFSEHSYGFRAGRRAQDAVLAAQTHVQAGRRIVVDVDVEKFFDRVNHDILIDEVDRELERRRRPTSCAMKCLNPSGCSLSGPSWTANCSSTGFPRSLKTRRRRAWCMRPRAAACRDFIITPA